MYKKVKTDKQGTTVNDITIYPVATLQDESGGRCQIAVDDNCYVLYLKQPKGKYALTTHIFPEAFKVLAKLPEL